MLRQTLMMLARSERAKTLAETMPGSSDLVGNYVPGERIEDAVRASRELVAQGLLVTLDYLGEDTTDHAQADQSVEVYLELLDALGAEGLAGDVEVSVKLSAVGQALEGDGRATSLENARRICRKARNVGTTVTVDMEDHTTTDATLATVHELRLDFPETGLVLQSGLRRTERDLRRLTGSDSRVRLCKGAYAEPDEVAHDLGIDTDRAYVRCLRQLMESDAYPMVATHDPRLVDIAASLAERNGRTKSSYEFQMLYGVRPEEQLRLAAAGHRVRVYVPFGEEWYGYLVRRLAERPANMMLFVRSLVSKK